MSIRYNVEICYCETGEEEQQNYLTPVSVIMLLRRMSPGDALVINAVEGPGRDEI